MFGAAAENWWHIFGFFIFCYYAGSLSRRVGVGTYRALGRLNKGTDK